MGVQARKIGFSSGYYKKGTKGTKEGEEGEQEAEV